MSIRHYLLVNSKLQLLEGKEMGEHILCRFSSIVPKQEHLHAVYDFSSQISYYDMGRMKKVIDLLDGVVHNSRGSSVEITDKTNHLSRVSSSIFTENIENSDVDNYHLLDLGGTMETRGTETSDVDHFWKMLSTTTTFATENTDKDN